MSPFVKKIALRIASITLAQVLVVSPIAWFMAREHEEEESVVLAVEESRRFMHNNPIVVTDADAVARAQKIVNTSIGGLFEVAEIYTTNGRKLAKAMTPEGGGIEKLLAEHPTPSSQSSPYESVTLPDGSWALRVFVPLLVEGAPKGQEVAGYFEGVRVIPEWRVEQIRHTAYGIAAMTALASLLCGLMIFPAVVYLSTENEHKARRILDSHLAMMNAMGRAVAKRDSDTGAHNYRVAYIAVRIGECLGLSRPDMEALIIGSYLHDVGKIAIPDAILLKPGRLDDEEMAIMRTHVVQGEHIVEGISWLASAAVVVAGHHEKWDGSGYPRRLQGEEIPFGARIFAVADVFDALCSKRPYKDPMDFDSAFGIIKRDSGSHFDPKVVAVFETLARELYDQLVGASEEACLALIEAKVSQHFEVGSAL